MDYDHKKIENKWQKVWEKKKIFKAVDGSKKPKFYGLIEFPYPSGDGLHVGHIRSNTAMDVICRKRRMEGFNVLYPIGWDAFGLPTENYAIKTGIHPIKVTKQNTDTFRRQLKAVGFSFDWDREINTTDPKYYKWTQWIFLQLLKHGLAYKKKMPINWCPKDKIGLANEEVVDGCCERCGTPVEKKDKEQWMLAITKYADRLDKDLDDVNFLEKIKIQQRNWIGRSEGVNLQFKVKDLDMHFEMYDSIPQTYMAQTFTVIAPDHPKLFELVKGTQFEDGVMKKAKEMIAKRSNGVYEKTGEMDGIFTGRYVDYIPAKRQLPIWVASFVVSDYGTGVVNCSFHDERDYAFAKKFDIPLHPVLFPKDEVKAELVRKQEIFYREEDGILEEPVEFKGRRWDEAREDIIKFLIKNGWGKKAINYKLRDWVFSRQHYWGEPIPVVFCEQCAKQKFNFVIIHGRGGSVDANFFPELKRRLLAGGHSVFAKNLPIGKDGIKIDEQVDFLLKNVEFNENTIIVAHSLGGIVVHKLLPRLKTKIHKVVFVDSFISPNFSDKRREGVEKSNDWEFDFKKARTKTKFVEVLGDSSEGVIPKKENDALALAYGVEVNFAYPSDRHFCGSDEPAVFGLTIPSGFIPVPEKDLPVKLPNVEKYQPTDDGESPLSSIEKWVNTKCPHCGGHARRETDTMPNWAGSSWYYLAYLMKSKIKNKKLKIQDFDKEFNYWSGISEKLSTKNYQLKTGPVDWYNGGMEHTTLHLLYSRFWHKFLFDIGVVPTKEPYNKRTSHGLILAEGGVKMSKSKGNVINPDDIVNKLGADSLRIYEMFMGPFDQAISWSVDGIVGARRFVEKVWRIGQKVVSQLANSRIEATKENINNKLETLVHKTIKKVGEDIEGMRFNTTISALMICANEMDSSDFVPKKMFEDYLKIFSPFAPHLAEELWNELGNKDIIALESWPKYDETKMVDDEFMIMVQINGKIRGQFLVSKDISEDEVFARAKSLKEVQNWIEGKSIKKEIYVKGKLVSLVV